MVQVADSAGFVQVGPQPGITGWLRVSDPAMDMTLSAQAEPQNSS